MQEIVLKATKREAAGSVLAELRRQSKIPGVVYGQGKAATAIAVDEAELLKAYHQAGTSKIIDLAIEGEDAKSILFHDVQFDHLGKKIIHFDLYTVKMDEAIQTEVPIHFIGESPVVYEQNATLLKNLETIEVKALPRDLPEKIEVDISALTEMEQSILVRDLKLPEGVQILAEPEEMIVKTEAPREEEIEPEEEELSEEERVAQVAAEHGGEAATEDEAEVTEGEQEEKPAENDKK